MLQQKALFQSRTVQHTALPACSNLLHHLWCIQPPLGGTYCAVPLLPVELRVLGDGAGVGGADQAQHTVCPPLVRAQQPPQAVLRRLQREESKGEGVDVCVKLVRIALASRCSAYPLLPRKQVCMLFWDYSHMVPWAERTLKKKENRGAIC